MKPVVVQGVPNCLHELANVEVKVARKAIRRGINEGTILLVKTAKGRVPRESGALAKSMGRKVKASRKGQRIYGIVGPRSGFTIMWRGRKRNPVKYAHLVEFGHEGPKPAGPHPFMRATWDTTEHMLITLFELGMRKELMKYRSNGRNRP